MPGSRSTFPRRAPAPLAAVVLVALSVPSAAFSASWESRDLHGLGYHDLAAFQRDNGLATDGVYGRRAERALTHKVEQVQRAVGVTVDGHFGATTEAAVAGWQRGHHMAARGTAGAPTMAAMHVARTVWISAKWEIAGHGWVVTRQFPCLDKLWQHESGWKVYATNPNSGAYGIPQAYPAGKMAAAGPDWRWNPATQIAWGENYIAGRYGTPCAAWAHAQRYGWYGLRGKAG